MVEVEPALAVSDDDIPADWDVEDSTIGIAVLVSTSSVVVDTGTSVEGDSVVLPQHPFFNGRQLVQDRPDFTHEQNLQRAIRGSYYSTPQTLLVGILSSLNRLTSCHTRHKAVK